MGMPYRYVTNQLALLNSALRPSSYSVARTMMECCRVDDTSPERAVIGLSLGRVDPYVD